jgi:hypothetical protein
LHDLVLEITRSVPLLELTHTYMTLNETTGADFDFELEGADFAPALGAAAKAVTHGTVLTSSASESRNLV